MGGLLKGNRADKKDKIFSRPEAFGKILCCLCLNSRKVACVGVRFTFPGCLEFDAPLPNGRRLTLRIP